MGRHRAPLWRVAPGIQAVMAGILVGSCGTTLSLLGYAVFAPALGDLTPTEVGVGLLTGGASWLAGLMLARRTTIVRPLLAFSFLNVIRAVCCAATPFLHSPEWKWAVTCLLLLVEGVMPQLISGIAARWPTSKFRHRVPGALHSFRHLGYAAGVGSCGVLLLLEDQRAYQAALIGIGACGLLSTLPLPWLRPYRPAQNDPPADAVPEPEPELELEPESQPEPRQGGPSRRRHVRLIIAFHGLSSFCYGLVFPYTGILLSERAGIGTQGVAVYYAAAGTANLVVALILALGRMRPPLVTLAMTGNALSIIGYLVVPLAATMPAVAVAAVATGAGQGCFLAAIIPIVNGLVPEDERRATFARRYQVLNATLAGGALAAGILVSVFSADVLPHLFVVNALGYLPIALALLSARSIIRTIGTDDGEETATARPLPVGRLLRAAAAVSLFQFGVYLLGYSQFEATAPLAAVRLMNLDVGWVSVLIAANVATILLAQAPTTKLLGRYSEVVGLRWTVGLWVLAYLVVGVLGFGPEPLRLTGLLLYGVIFALGECAYSCSFHPWLISKVPERELTRANALVNSSMGIGLFFGPSIGVLLIGLGSSTGLWLSLALMCAIVSVATVRRRPVVTAA